MRRCDLMQVKSSSLLRFLDHTWRRTTLCRTTLDEGSARRRDFYLKAHNHHYTHPCHRWGSNPQSQKASCRRPLALNCAAREIGVPFICGLTFFSISKRIFRNLFILYIMKGNKMFYQFCNMLYFIILHSEYPDACIRVSFNPLALELNI